MTPFIEKLLREGLASSGVVTVNSEGSGTLLPELTAMYAMVASAATERLSLVTTNSTVTVDLVEPAARAVTPSRSPSRVGCLYRMVLVPMTRSTPRARSAS
jgi:hypothetical protein